MSSFTGARRLVRASIVSLGIWALGGAVVPGPVYAADDVSEIRAVGAFDRVEVSGAFKTDISAGQSSRVTLSGTRGALDTVTTKVHDRTLTVGIRDGAGMNGELPTVTIALPALRGFTNSGFGSAKIGGLNGGEIDIVNAGAASIVVAGRAGHETIELNGAGKIDATGVDAKDVEVDNNGVGLVEVRASGSLEMNVNGVGMIRYAGSPAHVESHVNGFGRIQKI